MNTYKRHLFAIALFTVLIALIAIPTVLVSLGVQSAPLVQPSPSAGHDDVGRLKALLREHDPRDLQDGQTRTLTISERDLNLGLRSVLPMAERQSSQVAVNEGLSVIDYTLVLPANPLGEFLNMSLAIRENNGALAVDALRVGKLSLPGWSVAPLIALADRVLKSHFEEYEHARIALQAVYLGNAEASITYRWDEALARKIEQRGREMFLSPADRERALAYYHVLSRTSRAVGWSAPLDRLLQPLFAAALKRSSDGDAAAENRALLLVLGTVLNRSSTLRLVGGDWADLAPGHRYVQWTLHNRGDLAQHFGVSAAIAVAGGGVLANSIGVFKELDDSRDGTGFSFPDLLADRAGVELALAATGPEARRVQQAIARDSLREADIMPPIDKLPEGLMELQFIQRYSDLDDPRYVHVKRVIDTRVASLSIHR